MASHGRPHAVMPFRYLQCGAAGVRVKPDEHEIAHARVLGADDRHVGIGNTRSG